MAGLNYISAVMIQALPHVINTWLSVMAPIIRPLEASGFVDPTFSPLSFLARGGSRLMNQLIDFFERWYERYAI
jgi:hypothetical protein